MPSTPHIGVLQLVTHEQKKIKLTIDFEISTDDHNLGGQWIIVTCIAQIISKEQKNSNDIISMTVPKILVTVWHIRGHRHSWVSGPNPNKF